MIDFKIASNKLNILTIRICCMIYSQFPVRADLQSDRSRVFGFLILQRQIWLMRYFRGKVAVFQKLCIFAGIK